MKWLGLDIGGANLKAADAQRFAVVQPFPLWQKPRELVAALRALIALARGADHLAVTLTGELADCFTTKAEGVRAIVEATAEAADGRHTRVYLTTGMFVTPQVAMAEPLLAAAANWHAMARFGGRYAKHGPALLVDIGTTTCDLVPLVDGQPRALGKTDPERMAAGELVYTGVERTPLCAVLASTVWRGQDVPLAHEMFSTMWDVYLTLGALPEEPHSLHTADHRAATRACAYDRLARSICADRSMFSIDDALVMAEAAAAAQLARIEAAARSVIERMPEPPRVLVLCGRGAFLGQRLAARLDLGATIVSLEDELGAELSQCATAHALAVLASEGCP